MRSCLALPVVVLACVGGVAIPAATSGAGDSRIDAIFAPLADAKTPGAAVLMRKNGRTIFERGYGVRDLRTFKKSMARRISGWRRLPSNSRPWRSCCWCMTKSFAITSR